MKYVVEGLLKVRDVFDADNPDEALIKFRAIYPGFVDKGSTITGCTPLPEWKEGSNEQSEPRRKS